MSHERVGDVAKSRIINTASLGGRVTVDITSSPQGDGNMEAETEANEPTRLVDITSSPQGDGNFWGYLTPTDEELTLHLPRKGMETAIL